MKKKKEISASPVFGFYEHGVIGSFFFCVCAKEVKEIGVYINKERSIRSVE